MLVGPIDDPVELGAADFVVFDASVDHRYQRIGRGQVRGLLVITRSAP